jgi:protein-S-isoprenylcysteine O-methyltransferase Ste14
MLKLPPPIWALFYLIVAAAISYVAGWPRVPGLPLAWLGILLIVLGGALAVTAARLFRREGTEINPTSPANRKLVTSGPYSFTRNPMYLGLTIISLGRCILGRLVADVPGPGHDFRDGELGAHPLRGRKDAPPVRRRIRRLCAQGQAVALTSVRALLGTTVASA